MGVAQETGVAGLVELRVAHERDDILLGPAFPDGDQAGFQRRQLAAIGPSAAGAHSLRVGPHLCLQLRDALPQVGLDRRGARFQFPLLLLQFLHRGLAIGLGQRRGPLAARVGALAGEDLLPPEILPGKFQESGRQRLRDQRHVHRQAQRDDALAELAGIERAAGLDGGMQGVVEGDVIAGNRTRPGERRGGGRVPAGGGDRLGFQVRAPELVAAGPDAEGDRIAGAHPRRVFPRAPACPVHREGAGTLELQFHVHELGLVGTLVHRRHVDLADLGRAPDPGRWCAIGDDPDIGEVGDAVIHGARVLQHHGKGPRLRRQQQRSNQRHPQPARGVHSQIRDRPVTGARMAVGNRQARAIMRSRPALGGTLPQ